MEKQRIIHRAAEDWPVVKTRAPNSVFASGPRPRNTPAIDEDRLKVKYDVPMPPRKNPGALHPYDATLRSMRLGGCVDDLTEAQAKSMQKRGNALGVLLERRKLDNGHYGVWRVSQRAERSPGMASKGFPRRITK